MQLYVATVHIFIVREDMNCAREYQYTDGKQNMKILDCYL